MLEYWQEIYAGIGALFAVWVLLIPRKKKEPIDHVIYGAVSLFAGLAWPVFALAFVAGALGALGYRVQQMVRGRDG